MTVMSVRAMEEILRGFTRGVCRARAGRHAAGCGEGGPVRSLVVRRYMSQMGPGVVRRRTCGFSDDVGQRAVIAGIRTS